MDKIKEINGISKMYMKKPRIPYSSLSFTVKAALPNKEDMANKTPKGK